MKATLVSDGSSDKVLTRILSWLLAKNGYPRATVTRANLDAVAAPPPLGDLLARAKLATELYPCDLLFFHRDGEGETVTARVTEINERLSRHINAYVCVVPIRMTEAWLLVDAQAIRKASGNPCGTMPLDLPQPRRIEGIADPKDKLHQTLKLASALKGRRLKTFSVSRAYHDIVEHMTNFAALEQVPAFQEVERQLRAVLQDIR